LSWALQSLVDPEDQLELDELSDSAWRERIGNAGPPAAAAAVAGVMGTTLLLAATGQTFMLSSMPIWVRQVGIALSVQQPTEAARKDAVTAVPQGAGRRIKPGSESMDNRERRDRVMKAIETAIGDVPADGIGVSESLVDDLGFDSLDCVELVVTLEREFEIENTDDEAEKIITVQDVLDCVTRYIDAKETE
jgi:acyl carrier protein